MKRAWAVLAVVAVFLVAGCIESTGSSGKSASVKRGGKGLEAEKSVPLESIPIPKNLVWKQLAPAPTPRAEHCAAVLDGKIYSIGGYLINNNVDGVALGPGALVALASVEVYDIKAGTWSAAPDYPVTLNHEGCAAHDGFVYVFNGGSSFKLDVAKQTWIPIKTVSAVTAAVDHENGDIYLANPSGKAFRYVPATDELEELPNYPNKRSHVASSFVNGKFYIGNGDTNGHAVNTVDTEEFDPALGIWTARAPNPVARGSTVGTEWLGRFVVLGGQNQSTGLDKGDMIGFGQPAYPDVEAYNPITDTWTKLPDMPHGRHGFGAVTWDGKIYGVEGAPQEGVSGFAELIVLEPG